MKNNEINLHISSKLFTFAHRTTNKSGFGAVGSAHVWGARGRWFESSNPDSIYNERKDELHLSFFLFSRICISIVCFLYFNVDPN